MGLLIPRRFRPLGEQLQRLNCRESDLLDECDDRSVARQNKIALTKEESLRQGRRSQQCAVETSNAKAKRPRARKSECIIPPRVPDEALTKSEINLMGLKWLGRSSTRGCASPSTRETSITKRCTESAGRPLSRFGQRRENRSCGKSPHRRLAIIGHNSRRKWPMLSRRSALG